jgi:hypothetical protein
MEENKKEETPKRKEYRHLVLPNNVVPGDVVQIKYDDQGVVFDLFDKSMEECKEEFGYDEYSETTIPHFKGGITIEDVNELSQSAYNTLLKTMYLIEGTPAKDLAQAIAGVKQMVYEACPELLPKDPREA